MKIKSERVNAEIARKLAKIIADDIKDPRLGDSIVGVTKVSVTPDLKYAKAYLSIYAKDEESKQAAFDTIVRSKGFIRNAMKDEVKIRLMPEFTFVIDDSVDYGMKIESILSTITIPPEDKPDESEK